MIHVPVKKRKLWEEKNKQIIEREIKEREEVDVDKYFRVCLNGEEAYHALYNLMIHWFNVTDDMLYMTIMSCMEHHYDKKQEWALALKYVIEGRKPGMRNYLEEWNNEPIEGSCTCSSKEKK